MSSGCWTLPRGMIPALGLIVTLAGCGPQGNVDVISEDTFVEYCTVLFRAQEDAAGDPEAFRRALESPSLPSDWREQMVAFAEQNPKTAGEWADLISEALAATEQSDDR